MDCHAPVKSLVVLFLFGLCATFSFAAAFSFDYTACVSTKTQYFQIESCKKRTSSSSLHAVGDKIFDGMVSMLKRNNITQYESINEVSSISSPPRVPYVIQKIGRGNKREIKEITRLCIDVFFNEQSDDKETKPNDGTTQTQKVTPWKAMQLAYLRNSQTGDILARNAFRKDQMVEIIVARRVYSVADNRDKQSEYVQETDEIFNRDQLPLTDNMQTKFILGEIIGYCEVITKNFGLGKYITSSEKIPYLANLSVSRHARQSGVGSKLLDESEVVVRNWDAGFTSMVLQVEEDNTVAIQFYKKRGWKFVYADPTCRRFDTSGFFLKESRITKYAMVKEIGPIKESDEGRETESPAQRPKKLWFVSQ